MSCSDDLDGIEIKIWQDPSGELTALQSGASDLMALTPYDTLDDIRRNPNLQVLTSRSAAYDAMHMRVDTPPFDNPKVRQALALVLNRQEVLNIVLGPDGGELASDQPPAPVLRDHVDIPMKAQDLATAKQLLAEAGHPNGFEFDLPTHTGAEWLKTGRSRCNRRLRRSASRPTSSSRRSRSTTRTGQPSPPV